MKFLLRVFGTWMMGLTIILAVIDGTKSMGAGGLVMTSIGELWGGFDPEGFARFGDMAAEWLAPANAQILAPAVFSLPGWVICGVIGILLLLAGRARDKKGYLEPR